MDMDSAVRAVLSLIFVLALIGLVASLYKRYGLQQGRAKGAAKRLSIEEQIYLDPRRRVVLIKKDNEETLLLLSPNNETIISTNIIPQAATHHPRSKAAKPKAVS